MKRKLLTNILYSINNNSLKVYKPYYFSIFVVEHTIGRNKLCVKYEMIKNKIKYNKGQNNFN